MGIGVEAIISHCDLALVGDMGSDPGDELQVIHCLHFFGFFPILVADLACSSIQRIRAKPQRGLSQSGSVRRLL
jgi:hypothetical protein